MTSSLKPVGLYYEKKQPNQIEARNQFKTHDEIDRNRLISRIAIIKRYHSQAITISWEIALNSSASRMRFSYISSEKSISSHFYEVQEIITRKQASNEVAGCCLLIASCLKSACFWYYTIKTYLNLEIFTLEAFSAIFSQEIVLLYSSLFRAF